MENSVRERAARRQVGKKPTINTTMSKADIVRLESVCKRYDTTKGRLIRAIVLEWLDKYEAEQEESIDNPDN